MKPLMVKCPHCTELSELYLGSEAYMIVLNCPSCQAPLMYYYGKTLEIEQEEIHKIQNNYALSGMKGMLQNISAREANRQLALVNNSGSSVTLEAYHQMGEAVREAPLLKDDITNLRIALALCKDVSDFIGKL